MIFPSLKNFLFELWNWNFFFLNLKFSPRRKYIQIHTHMFSFSASDEGQFIDLK